MPQTKDKPIDVMDPINQTDETLFQTDEEEEEALRVQRLFRASYTSKQALGLPSLWKTCDDYINSKQGDPQSSDDPNSCTNIIRPIVQSQISDLIDKNYAISARGREMSDDLYSQQAAHMMEFVLDKNRFKMLLDVAEHDRLELGTSIYKVYFDDDELDGRGLPKLEIINPANFFPDPKIQRPDLIQQGEFIIHAVPRPLSWFRKQFKERGQYVKRQVAVPYDPMIFDGQHSDESDMVASMRALCIECYERDEDGELYRLTVANNILLEDSRKTKQKIQRRDRYPFVVIPCYRKRGMIWGMGDVELLIPTQDLINELDDQIRINARLMGNPQIAFGMGVGKGFDARKWTSKPALRIPMRDVNAFRVIEAKQISPDVPIRREKAFQEADTISGRPDVTRGNQPSQVTAYRAIAALQQAGQKGVIYKSEIFKEGIKDVLELLFDEIKENWDEGMWVRIEGKQPDYKFYNPGDFNNVPIKIPNTVAGPNEDRIMDLTDEKGQPMTRDAQFDFEFSIGDGLPSDKAFIYETLLDLSKLVVEGKPVIFWQELRDYLREEIGIPLKADEAMQPQAPMPAPAMMPQGQPMQPNNVVPMPQQGGMPIANQV